MAKKDASFQAPCARCGGRCCRYIAIGIDSPQSRRGRENIRWFLLHKKVAVYIDHNKDWFVEFTTPCVVHDKKKGCGLYDRRPKVCRDYGNAEGECEYYSTPHREKFETLEHFESWEEARKIRAQAKKKQK